MTRSADGWHTPVPADHAAAPLLTAQAVRRHCGALMAAIERGESAHFAWQPDQLAPTARYVADTIRLRYPDLAVPYHSRWRHFEAGGVDRWAALAARAGLQDDALERAPNSERALERAPHRERALERARVRIDLVIPSVLLDAGAGAAWRYADRAHGQTLSRSEGLGVASLALFEQGALSADARRPLRADAQALAALTPAVVGRAFQVSDANPLVGLEGRTALLQRLGVVAAATSAVFGKPARLGHLLDFLMTQSDSGRIAAETVLITLLKALGPVWPGRIAVDGVSLGDCWPHPAAPHGLVPFHKLTQWLTYSLLEPLEDAGLTVTGIDALTGLPEYRNGGLLLDMGLLVPRVTAPERSFLTRTLQVDEPAVVEWRAVTVVALDRIAEAVRAELGLSAARFPLARVLEGGTWGAGRRIAAERRPSGPNAGGPPVTIASDGTVF